MDISEPRHLLKKYYEETGEKLSLTGYVVSCLSQVLKKYPELNSFRKGNRLIQLNNVTISVLVERDSEGEKFPEPIGIKDAQLKTFRQINDEIRSVKKRSGEKTGSLSKMSWRWSGVES